MITPRERLTIYPKLLWTCWSCHTLGACLNLDMVMTDAAMSSLPSVTALIICPMTVWYCLICSSLHSSEVSNIRWSDSSSVGLAFLHLEPNVCLHVSRIFSIYFMGSATSVPWVSCVSTSTSVKWCLNWRSLVIFFGFLANMARLST